VNSAYGWSADGDTGRGQSETIGVILFVAIVLVLAALVGQFVFGLTIV
jgi:flagellin-like protein